jgi:integrase
MAKEKRRGHGEGAIFQRQDGRWVARIVLPNGKRKDYYTKTRKDAAARLRSAQKALDDGLTLDTGRQTLAAYLTKWLSASVQPSVKVKTYEGYESTVRVRVVPRLGNKQLAKLTALDLQGLYTDLAASGLSARSVHHTHRVLHRAFVQAMRWNLIARNPCDGAQGPRATRAEMKVWTPQQTDAFLISTREHPAHALYILALTTGMRQGELLGLRWQDVDLDAGRLAVRQALQRQRGNGLVFIEPKTGRSRRSFHLSQRAIAALMAHRDRQGFGRRAAGSEWQDRDLVFCDALGNPLDPSYQTATFKKATGAAGLPEIRFHDMRHTAATLLLSKGVHVKLVSEMLGHTTITLTLDTYSHLIPDMHGDAAAAMDAILSA